MALLAQGRCGHCADVVVIQSQTFQKIDGWGHGGGIIGGTARQISMLGPAIADPVNYQYLDYLIDDLGLTGSRTWEIGPRIDGTGNDHGDCDDIDWNLFQVDTQDAANVKYLVYFQNRVLANGYQHNFYSSPGYPTHASDMKPWVVNHPGERAQQIWASALYNKNTYGLNISYAVIYNEPGGSISSTILADDIKAVAPRLIAHGLATRTQYAEAVAPQTDWGFITPVQNDPDLWPFVGRISYHNYGTADPYRTYLRDYAKAKGLTTAQTEMGDPTFDDLYSDLTLGGVTYWEVAYSSSLTLAPNAGLTAFTPAAKYFRLRQVMHYIRPGDVRIGAASGDPSVRALAFTRNGVVTTIIENLGAAQTVNLSGLPPGVYGVSQSAGAPFKELGIRAVGSSGALTLANVPGGSNATTVYPYSGPNHPPTIQVWGANPGYVVAPANTATLSITANDPELDPLTYHWSAQSQPAGANAAFVAPGAASTAANGLTVAGTYVFNVDVSDVTNTSSKQLYLVVYDSNPPPVLGQSGFRIAAPYGLVFSDPPTVTHANIELPLSSVILQTGISDLANSDFTGRGLWSLVSQPAGANVAIGATTYIYVSIRATASNMTVPGDYVFQIDVSNPGHAPLTAQIICTVHPASSGPVINSITATPANLTLPESATQFSAATSGTADQTLRYWWVLKNGPAGAKPVFDHQGSSNTTVSNLVLPGSYTFTLRAFDDIHTATRDKTVTVSATPGAPVITSAATSTVIVGAAFTYILSASNNPDSFNVANLAPGLTFANGVISGAATMPGRWNILLSATNAGGTGNANLMLTVNLPAPVINSPLVADGVVNKTFNYTISATNCPATYSAAGLPAGWTLNAGSGLTSGTPTVAGTTTMTIIATNNSGADSKMLTIVIYPSNPPTPAITSPLAAEGAVGAAFDYAITATNTPTRYLAVGLPAGLNFDVASPNITGVPLVAGTFIVAIEAGNRGGVGTATLILNISPGPSAPPGRWKLY
ncbi:MAG: putative Ig domain-containing protein [Candidatus Sumerlaeota bacterium]|nr:putative Ig domain-containing protein [Candidatus Sumerlaeota bacterium]